MAKKRRKKDHCLNCNKGLEPWMEFCPKCGQENHIKRASIKLLTKDFLQDYWTFDSKLFRSLYPLMFKPGYLTKEFITGRRKKYIPPIRLYIFISFIFFLMSSWLNQESNMKLVGTNRDSNPTIIRDTFMNDKGEIEFNTINTTVDVNKEDLNGMDSASIQMLNGIQGFITRMSDPENMSKVKKQIKQKTPMFLFILIPLLALILRWFFYRKKHFYVDYLVFAIHIQTFIFVFLLFSKIISSMITIPFSGLIGFVVILTYSTISGKITFGISYTGSLFRSLGTGLTYYILGGLLAIIGFLIITMMSMS